MPLQLTVEFHNAFTRTITSGMLTEGQSYMAGSADANAIVVDGDDVRPQHATIELISDGSLRITPINTAPVTINGHVIREPSVLSNGDWLALGSALFQIKLPEAVPVTRPVGTPVNRETRVLIIGRHAGCDLEIASPLVSREHAKLYFSPSGGVEIEDLNSTNGTFVNGKQLTGRTLLKQGDSVAISSYAFLFTGDHLEPINAAGRVRVEVRGLSKQVVDRTTKTSRYLLDDISLVIEPGEFVVIFGTSGSGKSTLLDALNGRRPATSGRVLYNDMDLYASFDAVRASIGYVPQQDIVHRKISIQHALEYTAKLRLPPDTSDEEMQTYISNVLKKVELSEKATLPIDTPAPLSGGQLKRVSLAVELVANPTILFLDEVTSGLDAGTDKRMMRLFGDLAADHKTVICVTHSLENIDFCHQVVLLHKGKLVYFGPPKEAPAYFDVPKLSDVYELLEYSDPVFWADKFLQSPYYQTYVLNRLSSQPAAGNTHPTHTHTQSGSGSSHNPWFDLRQTATLMRRYLDLIFSDKKNLAILLLQAPLIALVIGLVFDTKGAPAARAAAESQIFFILVLSAIWFGTLNSARELVKEFPVYLRERSVNLGLMPYLTSKLVPLAALCLIQCALLMGIVSLMVSLPGSYIDRVLVLFMTGMAATCMGLAVSAFVDTNDKAVAMAPILLIPQVVLSNAVVKLGTAGLIVAKSSMIAFWGLDAMKTTLGKDSLKAVDCLNQLIVPLSGAYGKNLVMVAVLGCAFLVFAVLGLKLKDSKK